MGSRLYLRAGLALLLAAAVPAAAWWPKGHSILAEAAVRALPAAVPAFFRAGGATVAHLAQDPDVAKNRETPNVNDVEFPEHFLDRELLEGRSLPATRYAFLGLCAAIKLDPKDVGLVPYAIAEWTERLAVAFAEHRRWPENPHIRTKCLVYAGFLAHYATDVCMPLHTTVHYDGRVPPGGRSPRSGIHARVDALIEKLELDPAVLARGLAVRPLPKLLPGVVEELDRSHALVDRTYTLEAQLPPERGAWQPTAEVRAFAEERARASTRFLASLYLTAWEKSASLRLPPWLEREPAAKAAAPKTSRRIAPASTSSATRSR